jgi:hypothetical protein
MRDHAVMRMEDLRPEDFDDIDESTIQVNEARPVRGDEVTMILSVPFTRDAVTALGALEKRDGKTIFEIVRDAVDAYVTARDHERQAATSPRRRAS